MSQCSLLQLGTPDRLTNPSTKNLCVILPKQAQTTPAVAAHDDELDSFYREIWGEHVHHGYRATGRETATEATPGRGARIAKSRPK
jgi:hypothetical protein